MNKYESKALRLLKVPGGNNAVQIRKDIKQLCQFYAEDMVQVLYEIAADDENFTKDRITAATALLDRAYGKPGNAIEDDKKPLEAIDFSKLSTAELTSMLFKIQQEEKLVEYAQVENKTE